MAHPSDNWPRLSDVVTPDTLDALVADVIANRRALVGKWMGDGPVRKIPPRDLARAAEHLLLSEVFFAPNWVRVLSRGGGRPVYGDVRVQPITTKPAAKNQGGRPPIIDWDEFWVEVSLYAALNDLKREHRAELHSKMMDFCERRWGDDAPKESTVRSRLTKLFKRVPR